MHLYEAAGSNCEGGKGAARADMTTLWESGATFSPTFLDFFVYDSLRPEWHREKVRVLPPPRGYLAKQLLRTLVVDFRRDGAAELTSRAYKLLCPKKVGQLMDEEVHVGDLLDVCREFCADAALPYAAPSQSVYGFFAVLDLVWGGARERLADAFFHISPGDMLLREGELFHVVLRACGRRLQRFVAAAFRDVDDLERFCAARECASAVWQLVLVGAMPPKLARELAEPNVFFHRLTFSGCSVGGCWQVSLALLFRREQQTSSGP